MNRAIAWFVHNPAAANLLMMFILVGEHGNQIGAVEMSKVKRPGSKVRIFVQLSTYILLWLNPHRRVRVRR